MPPTQRQLNWDKKRFVLQNAMHLAKEATVQGANVQNYLKILEKELDEPFNRWNMNDYNQDEMIDVKAQNVRIHGLML